MKSIVKNSILILVVILITFNSVYGQREHMRLKSYTENVNEIDLVYSDDNRLSKIGYTTFNYDAEGRIIKNDKISYNYNDLGQVSQIISNKGGSFGNLETEIVYNTDSLIVSFVSKYERGDLGTATSTFEYDGNKRLKTIIEKGADGRGYGRITLTYDDNNNIVQQLKEKSYDGTSYRQVSVSNYTFDTKNNPSYNVLSKTGNSNTINIFHIIYNLSIGGQSAYETLYYYSKNNILSSKVTGASGNAATQTYTYVYDENDYPVSAKLEYSFSPDSSYNRTETRGWVYENY
ncbi:hypothetical protein JBL43_03200 [Aureibaculum sp. A20]|uniref:RHS repeat protein n=1 Tax=Aureibaculum flavum TaxID=2795986 RepID=A0ABS0WMM5_9FLAO|nr:hypothetical protein [Aureibaculum flavum]MBJ2173226.1 hypothetical protein [Aureibaculum flavum]